MKKGGRFSTWEVPVRSEKARRRDGSGESGRFKTKLHPNLRGNSAEGKGLGSLLSEREMFRRLRTLDLGDGGTHWQKTAYRGNNRKKDERGKPRRHFCHGRSSEPGVTIREKSDATPATIRRAQESSHTSKSSPNRRE